MTPHEKVTDFDIQALVDRELSHESHDFVLSRVQESPLFQKRYAELSHQNDLLKLWWSIPGRTS